VSPRQLLLEAFRAALQAVDPIRVVPPRLPPLPVGRTLVAGAGKASAAMAAAVERRWPKDAFLSGKVITRYGHGLPDREAFSRIQVTEAGHPLPDETGARAVREMFDAARLLGPDDLLLALISGGGSSLMMLPAGGLTLADIRTVTHRLLNSGARIEDINVVRKHLSASLGGRLALAAGPARVEALIVSDVTGDDPAHVASGPCAPDPSTYTDALDILLAHGNDWPCAILDHLRLGIRGDIPDTPKPGLPRFENVRNQVIARGIDALQAASEYLVANGVTPVMLGDQVSGEARGVAAKHAGLARLIAAGKTAWKRPAVLISGGETTVAVKGGGKGGRNCEYALALALELNQSAGIYAIAADTDGIDGTGDNAGAIIYPDTLVRAAQLKIDVERYLAENNSYGFFAVLGDLVMTGPTRTNVNDFRAILID
jgi:glycerate 2-kinase